MATTVDQVTRDERPTAPMPSAVPAPVGPSVKSMEKEEPKVAEKDSAAQDKAAQDAAVQEAVEAANDAVVNGEKTPKGDQTFPVASGALVDSSSKDEAQPAAKLPDPTEPVSGVAQPDHQAAEASFSEAAKPAGQPAETTSAAPPSDPTPAAATAEAPSTMNGDVGNEVDMKEAPTTASPVAGEKRKPDEPADTNGEVPEKKAKTDAAAEATTNGHEEKPAPKKAGRPKKEKKERPPPGKAVRKTRSQGPVEA